ncbi:uncharacterized protein F4822DRAFT_33063 [Hypoxylon trugodes]|uniref:uncharacterized protein n=1 Tax=Hypoxylon trugodes TaxID=326681 RepID=UPI0021935BE8|nr:uncharacterized protein F4822DRAFT_33063 [Hypoxylon trugodes]KAI1393989.1 hypothetical protein F4822DRAFT_33063 [Hypoxylon trugodes]
MSSAPFLFLSPALPSELLTYILNHHAHPTTLIICSSRLDFLTALADDVHQETVPAEDIIPAEQYTESGSPVDAQDTHDVIQEEIQIKQQHRLLSSPLYQVATSRHIRVIYIPTVTHLRAYLSVFSPDDSRIPQPPASFNPPGNYSPRIILYGFLDIHRDTSEWSAQGLGNSAATLVELGHRLSWQTIIIEPQRHNSLSSFEDILKEAVPFLSGGGRKLGPDPEEGGWTGRTVEVGRVMRRWFRFQRGLWDTTSEEDKEETHDMKA